MKARSFPVSVKVVPSIDVDAVRPPYGAAKCQSAGPSRTMAYPVPAVSDGGVAKVTVTGWGVAGMSAGAMVAVARSGPEGSPPVVARIDTVTSPGLADDNTRSTRPSIWSAEGVKPWASAPGAVSDSTPEVAAAAWSVNERARVSAPGPMETG